MIPTSGTDAAVDDKNQGKSMRTIFAAALIVIAAPAFGEEVHIDFGSTAGPLTHVGSGILHSINATLPSDDLLAPLKPQLFRAFPWGTAYDRAIGLGAEYQIVVANAYDFD